MSRASARCRRRTTGADATSVDVVLELPRPGRLDRAPLLVGVGVAPVRRARQVLARDDPGAQQVPAYDAGGLGLPVHERAAPPRGEVQPRDGARELVGVVRRAGV